MAKYRGIVREIYTYGFEVEADSREQAITKMKDFYNHPTKGDGIFVADANSFSRVEFMTGSNASEDGYITVID